MRGAYLQGRRILTIQHDREVLRQPVPPLRDGDAALKQHGSELVDQRGALANQP
jgi:hypothetical protein